MLKHSLGRLIVAVAALAVTPAHAFTIDATAGNGNSVDTSFSSAAMLSLELGLTNTRAVSVALTLQPYEQLSFNGLVNNFIGLGFEHLTLDLQGAAFAPLGSAAGTFGSVASVAGSASHAAVGFSGPEYVQATLGDWYLDGSGMDFGIRAGSAGGPALLTIAVAVPEPGSLALLLAGLAVVGASTRRRKSA